MTFEIEKVEKIKQPESEIHYKFTTYKTVTTKAGSEVEVKDREQQYTLTDLENRKDRLQEQVDEWQEKIDAIKNL